MICALLGTKVWAQLFETSTEANPKWYYIQVDGTGDNVGKVVTESNGQIVGMPIANGLVAKAKQLWRFEASATANQFVIVSNSGKKLDVAYDATLGKRIAVISETPTTEWKTDTYSTSFYLSIVTQPTQGTGKYLTVGDATLDNLIYFDSTNLNARFKFISFDVPLISTDDEIAWMLIRTTKTGLSNQCVTEEDETNTSDIKLSMQDYAAGNFRQQWKIVSATGSAVNFVNRATGHLIGTTPVFNVYNYIQYIPANETTGGWTIAPLTSNQYEVYTGPANAGKYWNAATENEDRTDYKAGASLNTGFAWIFQFMATETNTPDAIHTPEGSNEVSVYARDRRIYVNSTDPYQVYTLYGVRVNGNQELPAGVYLVSVKGQTAKVIVK